MARQPNPFSTEALGSDIGYSLGRALFGDPQAAALQATQRAQMDRDAAEAEAARARAGYSTSQTTGQDIQNTANSGLPQVIASMFSGPHAAVPARAPHGDEPDDGGEIPAVPELKEGEAFRSGLPAMIAAFAQGGHGANISEAARAAAAFAGDDELARRGLVAGGNSPTADFAITPERADHVAWAKADADRAKAMGVANVRAGATRYGADQSRAASNFRANTSAGASKYRVDHRPPPAARATKGGPIATNAQGHKVQWTGQAWVAIK